MGGSSHLSLAGCFNSMIDQVPEKVNLKVLMINNLKFLSQIIFALSSRTKTFVALSFLNHSLQGRVAAE